MMLEIWDMKIYSIWDSLAVVHLNTYFFVDIAGLRLVNESLLSCYLQIGSDG